MTGEPGRTRAPLTPASELAAFALDAIRADMPVGGNLLVMVNGMGGTPLIELYLMFNEVRKYLEAHGGQVARNLVGNYITSLEMQGFSATVCQLTDALTRLWDAPVDTPALRRTLGPAIPTVYQGAIMDAEVFRAWIVSAAGVIEANRDHLTQLDAAIGDADHGTNLARGFTAVLGALSTRRPSHPRRRGPS